MIDKIHDDSTYNNCEFCTENSKFCYFDTEHLMVSNVLTCKKHEVEAINKVMEIIK